MRAIDHGESPLDRPLKQLPAELWLSDQSSVGSGWYVQASVMSHGTAVLCSGV